ncbi:MAG: type II 3-dehydroquinate dehydratase [Chloroflexi bacterium]|nr:type II 3-dehydroquinate dehydratase [Chloroflexota bacterium]
MKTLILHGPNLNLLGLREKEIYGLMSLDEINARLAKLGESLNVEINFAQSNHEGVLIDTMQEAQTWSDGIVFNPGAYGHTSLALRDVIKAIKVPVIEVHISNTYARESERNLSVISPVCKGVIVGFGWTSYALGVRALYELSKGK